MAEENTNIKISDSVEAAPFRSVGEFIKDTSRFQLPTFNDLKKWNNRIVTNLLYYQTNYFVLALGFVLLACCLHAKDVVVGTAALGLFVAVVVVGLSKRAQLVKARTEHPYAFIAAIGVAGYIVIYALASVITLLFIFAFPLLGIFVHASLRLRNLNSKVNMKLESLHMRRTIMGQLLDLINVDIAD